MAISAFDDTETGYRHEAFFYGDRAEFMRGTLAFIREAVAEHEPILVVLSAEKIDALRNELEDAERVTFADMNEVGANPARIIPAWQDFLVDNARPGRRVRGIGEPISAERGRDELVECHRHEALLNVAFDDPAFWLLCPYDTQALDRTVIDQARATHPFVWEGSTSAQSAAFAGNTAIAAPFDHPLPEPEDEPAVLAFARENLRGVRTMIESHAPRASLSIERTADLVLAVYEISTNSVQYGGGRGTLRVWFDETGIVCEVSDAGHLSDPMLGRVRPQIDANGGRGTWLANHLCDLVQVRSFATGTVTRLHMRSG